MRLIAGFATLMCLIVGLAGASAYAGQKIARDVLIVGPAGDQADRVIEILKARLETLDLYPTFQIDGENIRIEVDRFSNGGYELDLITFRALPKIHDGVEVSNRCPTTPVRKCFDTPEHLGLDGLLNVPRIAAIGGDIIEEASLDRDGPFARITLRFKPRAARQFAELTGENIGKRLALVADDTVLTVPVVREKIAGGVAIITGEVEYMAVWAILLSHPPLPYGLNFIGGEEAEPIVRNKRTRK